MIKVDGMNDGESDAIQRLQEEQTFVRPSFRPPLSSGVNRNLCPFNQMLNLIQMCQKKGQERSLSCLICYFVYYNQFHQATSHIRFTLPWNKLSLVDSNVKYLAFNMGNHAGEWRVI